MHTNTSNEITFIALQHPLPARVQKELKALAGEIALARNRLNGAIACHDDQLTRNAARQQDDAITALDMTILALRSRIGVEFSRPSFRRCQPPTVAPEA